MNMVTFLQGFEEKGIKNDSLEDQLSKEKKKILFSFCEKCNIQLNSAAQAQVHYNGKSHNKRVKQLSNGQPLPTAQGSGPLLASPSSNTSTGSTCHTTSLLLHWISNYVYSPNFNTTDPVQKIVINHTFGVSIPPKKKQVVSCNVCQLHFNSDSQAEAHCKGSKHAEVKALEATKSKPKMVSSKDSAKANPSGAIAPLTGNSSGKSEDKGKLKANSASQPSGAEGGLLLLKSGTTALPPGAAASPSKNTNGASGAVVESEKEKAKKLLHCSLCKVAVNSLSQLGAHNTGSKHKTMVEARDGAGPIKSYLRPGSRLKMQNGNKGAGLQNKTFHCEICDVHANYEIQLKQHISSRRHKDRVAGKPLRPKYSPYNKLQRSPSVLTAKLAFQKDMMKPLAPVFLLSPLAAAVAVSSAVAAAFAICIAFPEAGPRAHPSHPASILFTPY
uniref:C2H2-type domain-containing protein n=1 Tax=Chinchilla lanigera TaxID=34839 RepID=A0A8C2UW48_CHILA